MAASEDVSELFPLFVLTIMAIPIVPYTITQLYRSATKKSTSFHCQCSECWRSGKYSIFKRILKFLTCTNLALLLLWLLMIVLVYSLKDITREIEDFDPFRVLGLDPGAAESEIKKKFRRLSLQYHPDKNPDPKAHKYFVEHIVKAYQALTDPKMSKNYKKYGHPDGYQGFQIDVALPRFMLNIDGATGGVLLLWIVVAILLPVVVAVMYLSVSSKYNKNYVMNQTLHTYLHHMKPSLDPSKVKDVFIKANEFMEIPCRRTDNEQLHKLFELVRNELNFNLKNIEQEQAKTKLLVEAQLTRQFETLPPPLQSDLRTILKLAPSLLEELMKMAVIPRNAQEHGWLRPAFCVVELFQSIIQAVPLRTRNARFPQGVSPFLQLPHITKTVIETIATEKLTFRKFRDMNSQERADLLIHSAGLSSSEVQDIAVVLDMMPCITFEGTEGRQEGDIVIIHAWLNIKRRNGLIGALPHAPYYPFHKEESFWILVADSLTNNVLFYQRVNFMDEAAAIAVASKAVKESMEGLEKNVEETRRAVSKAIEKVKGGSRLVMVQILAPSEGNYDLTFYCLCDSWLGCDIRAHIKLNMLDQTQPAIDDTDEDNDYDENECTEDEEDKDSDYDENECTEDEGSTVKDGKDEYGEDKYGFWLQLWSQMLSVFLFTGDSESMHITINGTGEKHKKNYEKHVGEHDDDDDDDDDDSDSDSDGGDGGGGDGGGVGGRGGGVYDVGGGDYDDESESIEDETVEDGGDKVGEDKDGYGLQLLSDLLFTQDIQDTKSMHITINGTGDEHKKDDEEKQDGELWHKKKRKKQDGERRKKRKKKGWRT